MSGADAGAQADGGLEILIRCGWCVAWSRWLTLCLCCTGCSGSRVLVLLRRHRSVCSSDCVFLLHRQVILLSTLICYWTYPSYRVCSCNRMCYCYRVFQLQSVFLLGSIVFMLQSVPVSVTESVTVTECVLLQSDVVSVLREKVSVNSKSVQVTFADTVTLKRLSASRCLCLLPPSHSRVTQSL